jgi:hypothetical protein
MSDQTERTTPDFDSRLAELATIAAQAADVGTTEAIRRRGAQRARRGRITGALLTVAAACAVAAGVVDLNGPDRSAPPVVPSGPGVSRTPEAWRTITLGAWLPAGQYPLHGTFHWVPDGRPEQGYAAQSTYTCQNRGMEELGLQGGQSSGVKGTSGGWTDRGGTWKAFQQILFFRDATVARRAYAAMEGDMKACQAVDSAEGAKRKPPVQVNVERTASIGQGSAWSRTATRALYDADGRDEHTLIVQRGGVVSILWLYWNQGPHPAYDTSGDRALLQKLATRLSVYGTG